MTDPILVPTPQQLAWQRVGFGMFCHFGVNTYSDREWSDGTLPAASFAPSDLDARQWVDTALEAGMRYIVLTAKHHDGFCLWPTDTTEYSVRSSPWRSGSGDVVGELAEACRDAGLAFGLYLSPWDRNAPCYPDQAAYDDFYAAQLTELCTRYGPLFEIWFDGAGSDGRAYDWDRYMGIIDEHQPDAVVFNMGRPTIRWVGNEDGLAADPVRYVSRKRERGGVDPQSEPLYLPPECDVPIRTNWFWQTDDLQTLKSLQHLLAIYYRSVGLGAGLLLNVGIDRRGRVDDADRSRLLELGAEIDRRFSVGVVASVSEPQTGVVQARFEEPVTFDHLVIEEDLSSGQRIAGHRVIADGREIASGQTVGVRRFHAFDEVLAQDIEIRFDGDAGRLRGVTAHRTGVSTLPSLEPQPGPMDKKGLPDPADI